jgi:CheY-like chemotaxis protein
MPTVLLVEDDRSILELYKVAFVRTGYRFEMAESGQIGLEKAKQILPDIIILDLMMPGMNGIEVLEKLKADSSLKHIPVIALTNMSEFPIVSRATSKGADQYIVKTEVEPHKLVDIVVEMIKSSEAEKT